MICSRPRQVKRHAVKRLYPSDALELEVYLVFRGNVGTLRCTNILLLLPRVSRELLVWSGGVLGVIDCVFDLR